MCWGGILTLASLRLSRSGKWGLFFFFFSKSLTFVFELTHCCLDYSLTGTHWCVETLLLRRSTWKRRTSVLKKFATTCPPRFPLLLRNSSQASCRRIPVTDSRWIRSSTTNSSKYVDLREISCQCYETQLWHFYLEVKECENVSAWSVISTENRVGTLQPLQFFLLFLMHHLCLFLRVSLLTNFPPAAVQWCQSYTLPALPRNSSLKWPKAYLERRKQKVSKQHERFGGVSFSDLVLRISKSCCIYLNSPAFKHICCDYSVSCFHSGKNSMRGQRGQGYFQAGVGHR